MHQQLTLGITWVTAAANLSESPSLQKLPAQLRRQIAAILESLRHGETPQAVLVSGVGELEIQLEQLQRLGQMLAQGLPVAEIVSFLSVQARESFEQNIDRESQRLSLALLAPLFLGQAPALLVLLFGPLLRMMS